MAVWTSSVSRPSSPGATSNSSSSWTWSSIRDRSPWSWICRCTASMATLMMSAAEPWIGALSAIRSAISRRCRFGREVGQVAAAAHDRLGVAVQGGLGDDGPQVLPDAAELGEVVVHEAAGLLDGDAQLVRQPER